MKSEDVKTATIEQIENEINTVIADMKESIAEEDKARSKTANYKQYKERLAEAEKIKKGIEDYDQSKHDKDYNDFFLGCIKIQLLDLFEPIY